MAIETHAYRELYDPREILAPEIYYREKISREKYYAKMVTEEIGSKSNYKPFVWG
eukprot:CAMPEP_0170516400 /NCGR_PEP_ID=MMETSP0209-20121228/2622_1 /TAXON_ID=665100 ORGANISM="Litonotus pictus, Strain P1" /NCGR_SAMPLE_ID=MMETSP0209 /ASSEMBLY_ACC=CAM_ASM_000301 /LENGTH=54 /DNA_ID=CAMNT_0010801265 /DNA_START=211 /DNA_END=375 /DNA_ORIENTATION=+